MCGVLIVIVNFYLAASIVDSFTNAYGFDRNAFNRRVALSIAILYIYRQRFYVVTGMVPHL